MGEVPFREVYIHGLVRDAEGQKMSKSKGNILDPLDLIDGIDVESLVKKRTTGLMRPQDAHRIEKATRREFPDGIAAYGTDALRFTFAVLATQGRDIRFDVKRIEGYRNFCNKLWNASRYVLMALEGHDVSLRHAKPDFGVAERWIRSRLQHTIAAVTEGFVGYRLDLASQAIYEFVWDEFCDWYLELSKVTLNDANASDAAKAGTRQTLVRTLEMLLRLAHPIMPFITEEIWQRAAPLAGVQGDTIMRQPFPIFDGAQVDSDAVREIEFVKTFILGVRRIRSEMNIAPGKPLPVLVQGGNTEEQKWLQTAHPFIASLARTARIEPVTTVVPEAAPALAGEMTILIPLSDLIDPQAEMKRLAKERDGKRGELQRAQAKLANENYVARAPADIVARERARAEELAAAIIKLEDQLKRIETLRRN
jgi:valyl-tRNA synthetase